MMQGQWLVTAFFHVNCWATLLIQLGTTSIRIEPPKEGSTFLLQVVKVVIVIVVAIALKAWQQANMIEAIPLLGFCFPDCVKLITKNNYLRFWKLFTFLLYFKLSVHDICIHFLVLTLVWFLSLSSHDKNSRFFSWEPFLNQVQHSDSYTIEFVPCPLQCTEEFDYTK